MVHHERTAVDRQSGASLEDSNPGGLPGLPVGPPLVTVVVPTYREAENLPHLLDRLSAVRRSNGLAMEVIIVDDDSRDGSVEIIEARAASWVRIMVRTADRGLSQAVLAGFRAADGEVLVCMDADLSHPAEAIPEMVARVAQGADFVVGSRYVIGGSTAEDWGFLRWLNSRVATMLARPLTPVRDPMAGFFALPRTTLARGRDLNPVGYKIALELLVKCGCRRVVELPIHFTDRHLGQSKLTIAQQLRYLKHLRRLYIFKFGGWSELVQFLVVGAIGTVVNLAVLTVLLAGGIAPPMAIAAAIGVSICSNFFLNRRFSFRSGRSGPMARQFVNFVATCSVGGTINFLTALFLLSRFPELLAQVAAVAGVAAGTAFNFLSSRYLVFGRRKAHHPPAY